MTKIKYDIYFITSLNEAKNLVISKKIENSKCKKTITIVIVDIALQTTFTTNKKNINLNTII